MDNRTCLIPDTKVMCYVSFRQCPILLPAETALVVIMVCAFFLRPKSVKQFDYAEPLFGLVKLVPVLFLNRFGWKTRIICNCISNCSGAYSFKYGFLIF